MTEKAIISKPNRDARNDNSLSTQAGEFVREEFHHMHEDKHGARSAKQAIAIALSKARRAGVKLAPPARGQVSPKVFRQAMRESNSGQHPQRHSGKRPRSSSKAKNHVGRDAASPFAISRQAHWSAR